jgi:IS5 family transposase
MKSEGHLGRCFLKGRAGDSANAILSAVGYNFPTSAASSPGLRMISRLFLIALYPAATMQAATIQTVLNPATN